MNETENRQLRKVKPQKVGLGTRLALRWRTFICAIANGYRSLRRKQIPDYIIIELDGAIEERDPQMPWWAGFVPFRRPPISLESLDEALQKIAGDPQVKGVILLFKSPTMTLSQAQSMLGLFERLRQRDQERRRAVRSVRIQQPKRVIVYIESCGTAGYLAATGADSIYMAPQSEWPVTGLRSEPSFFKDSLAYLGIEFDLVKIAPWKSGGDQFTRSSMSEESRAQISWLLDSIYETITQTIANGRKLTVEQVRTLIDEAPLLAEAAMNADLIDGLAYEDELASLLADTDKPAVLKSYDRARRLLFRYARGPFSGTVGVISVGGAIMMGKSRSSPLPLPLFGSQTMGSSTVQQQIRAAREDPMIDAVVLHVDSPGGSALASDLIWRELTLLDREKPLVVFMDGVAASGGYYISAPGRKIIAQSATVTGSIGVFSMKPVTKKTYGKIGANREIIERGANAGLLSDANCWTTEQTRHMQRSIEHIYHEFKLRVAEGRSLDYENLDEICNGRVWTATQGVENGLVDQLGGIHVAFEAACEFAELPPDRPPRIVNIHPPKVHKVATPFEEMSEELRLKSFQELSDLTIQLLSGNLQTLLGRERFWMIAEWLPKID